MPYGARELVARRIAEAYTPWRDRRQRGGPRRGPARRDPLPAAVDLPAPGAGGGRADRRGRPAPGPPRPLRPLRPDLSTQGVPAQHGAGRPGHRHQRVHEEDAGGAVRDRPGEGHGHSLRRGAPLRRGARSRGRAGSSRARTSTTRRPPGLTRGTRRSCAPTRRSALGGRIAGKLVLTGQRTPLWERTLLPLARDARDRARRHPPGLRPVRRGAPPLRRRRGGGLPHHLRGLRPARARGRAGRTEGRHLAPAPSSTRSGCLRRPRPTSSSRTRCSRRSPSPGPTRLTRDPISWKENAAQTVRVLREATGRANR